jgi:membrane protein DedA with SNARE-associated domain
VDTVGAAGLGLILLLESLFPPLPSEPFLLAAGLASANGSGSAPVAILSAAMGMTLGATVWFYAARLIPAERLSRLVDRYGRLLLIRPGHLRRTVATFDRRRRVAVFSGRFLPFGRMLVSIPAGRSAMPLPEFLAATFLGCLVWSGLLIGLGNVVGDRQHLAVALLGHYTQTVLVLACTALLALAALALIRRFRRRASPVADR